VIKATGLQVTNGRLATNEATTAIGHSHRSGHDRQEHRDRTVPGRTAARPRRFPSVPGRITLGPIVLGPIARGRIERDSIGRSRADRHSRIKVRAHRTTAVKHPIGGGTRPGKTRSRIARGAIVRHLGPIVLIDLAAPTSTTGPSVDPTCGRAGAPAGLRRADR
jgi:hypothetical protein